MSYRARERKKVKKWYLIVAPSLFGGVPIGSTPADDPEKLIGRVLETTLYDITGDYTQVHVKLRFQIIEITDDTAKTRFGGHELARDYIKALTRRKTSKIQGIFNVTTKDGYGLRITALAFTAYRCKTSQKKAIRRIMGEKIEKAAREQVLDEFVQSMLFESLATEIFEEAKKIYPLRKVEIYKSKLLIIPGPQGPQKATVVPSLTKGL
uniref:Small ribosomal subunit protein eS1 n=1 Tax=Fervidicoccus fontis TaxID=683846 RepID=A0A7J3ZJL6_9CREN